MAGFVFHELSEAAEAQLRPARAELAAMRVQRAALRLVIALKHNFNPDQPRVPAGQRGGGRWTGSAGFGEPLVRVAANGDGPLVPGGAYSVPVMHEPLDPARLNATSLPLSEQQEVANAVNVLNAGDSKALRLMQAHRYRNIPDPDTGAALPAGGDYSTYYIGAKTGKKRLLIDKTTGQMYYTNNHYLSFWLVVPLGR